MAGGFDWMLNLNGLATKPGDGLNPRLLELLRARQTPLPSDVPTLPTTYASSGLANQTYSQDDLKAAGIPRIGTARGHIDDAASQRSPTDDRQHGSV